MPTSPKLDSIPVLPAPGLRGAAVRIVTLFPIPRVDRGPRPALLARGDVPGKLQGANMKTAAALIAVAAAGLFSAAASAQTVGSEVQRDVNQQRRIEQGLKSGSLNTREASQLERGEARIERMEANAAKDGTLSPAEKARIQRAQNQESRQINRLENNAAKGNPNSASSQRMQADVQRNVNQQQRIEQGIQSGQLTNREARARPGAGQPGRSARGRRRKGRTERAAAHPEGGEQAEQAHLPRKARRADPALSCGLPKKPACICECGGLFLSVSEELGPLSVDVPCGVQCDTIDFPGDVAADVALAHVVRHLLRVALLGRPEAPAAAGAKRDRVAGVEPFHV